MDFVQHPLYLCLRLNLEVLNECSISLNKEAVVAFSFLHFFFSRGKTEEIRCCGWKLESRLNSPFCWDGISDNLLLILFLFTINIYLFIYCLSIMLPIQTSLNPSEYPQSLAGGLICYDSPCFKKSI